MYCTLGRAEGREEKGEKRFKLEGTDSLEAEERGAGFLLIR